MKSSKIILFLIVVFLTSCKKDGQEHTISGRILLSCTNQPFANKTIRLMQEYTTNWGLQSTGGEIGSATTDSNGNFTLKYKAKNSETLRIQVAAGAGYTSLMEKIPAGQETNDVIIHINAKTHLQIFLKAINPLSSNDTLFVTDFRDLSKFLKISGPFKDTCLYTKPDFEVPVEYYVPTPNMVPNFMYRINGGAWKYEPYYLKTCDTTKIELNID